VARFSNFAFQMREIFIRFKQIADKKKTVTDSDLRCLLNDEYGA